MWLQAGWYRRRFRSAEPALWIDADWEDWSAQNPRVQSRARRGVLDDLAETANRFLGRRWRLPFGVLLLAVVAALLGQLREQKLDRDAVAARTAYNWESALTAVTASAVLLGGGLLLVRWRWSRVIRGWRNDRADPQDRPKPEPQRPEPLDLDDLHEALEPAAPWEPPAPHSKPAVKPRRAAEPRVVNDMPVEDGFGAETVHGDPVASNRPPRRPRPPAQPAADPAPSHDDGMDYDN